MSLFAELLEQPVKSAATRASTESTQIANKLKTISAKTTKSVKDAHVVAGQMGLDVIGIFDRTGVADLASAGVSFWRGDFIGGSLSIASALPIAEIFTTPLKLARNLVKFEHVIKVLMGAKAALAALPNALLLRGLDALEALAGLKALRTALGELDAKLLMLGSSDVVVQLRKISDDLFKEVLSMEVEVARKAIPKLTMMKDRIGLLSKTVGEGCMKLLDETVPAKVFFAKDLNVVETRITETFAKTMTEMAEYRKYRTELDALTKKFDIDILKRTTDPEQLKALAKNTALAQQLKASNTADLLDKIMQRMKEFQSAEQNFKMAARKYKTLMASVDQVRAKMFREAAGHGNLQAGYKPARRTASGFRIKGNGSSFDELLEVSADEGARLEKTLRGLTGG